MARKTMNSNVDKSIKITCRKCKTSTRHVVLSDVVLTNDEHEDFMWIEEYQTVQCRGCETISFRKTHQNSEDVYWNGSDLESNFHVYTYPNPDQGRDTVNEVHLLPTALRRIYAETVSAFNASQPVLTGIGIRAIVETVCKDKEAIGRDLKKKIDDLVKKQVLTTRDADILHGLRTLGNKAAHEVKPHEDSQLELALEVIDHILDGVYILPARAEGKLYT